MSASSQISLTRSIAGELSRVTARHALRQCAASSGSIWTVELVMRASIGVYPQNVQPEFIHLVGTIVTWWARIEGMMVFDVRWLRALPMSAKIAAQETFPTQTRRVIRHWGKLMRNGHRGDASKLMELEVILNEAFSLAEHRNSIVHSFWPYGQEKADEIRLTSMKPDPDDPTKVIYTAYEATIDQLDDVNTRLAKLYHSTMVFSLNSHKLADRPAT